MLVNLEVAPVVAFRRTFVNGVTGDLSQGIPLMSDRVPDGLAHAVQVVSDAAVPAGSEVLIAGLDADGVPISEVLSIGTVTAATAKVFSVVREIISTANVGSAKVDVGHSSRFNLPTIRLNWRINAPSHWHWLVVGSVVNASIDFSMADPGRFGGQEDVPWTVTVAGLASGTLAHGAHVSAPAGLVAARVRVPSFAAGATVSLYASQAEH